MAKANVSGVAVGVHKTSLPPAYFDTLYADNPDPWQFETSGYESEKYAATLAALPRERYASALEVGCSIGVLTHQLAPRCDTLLALDVAVSALDRARQRCATCGQVDFERRRVPAEWPDGRFDLILLSEVIYYLDRPDVLDLVARVRTSLLSGGDIVLVHWLGETHYPLGGDEAATVFIHEAADFAAVRKQARTDQYRLDVLSARTDF